jgi:ubiquinone/menaquinone biosynthesis C-methylase UbiE
VSEGPAVNAALGRHVGRRALCLPVHRHLISAEEGYDLWAPTYDLDPNPLLAAEKRVLGPLLKTTGDKVVLDVACGTGRWLETLIRAGARSAVGVDVSSAMLRVAQSKPALQQRIVRGDCLALPFPSRFADLIISSFVFGHLVDIETFAQELTRVAKHPADVWISDVHPEARAKGWTTGFRHGGENAEIATFSHSVEDIEQAFERQGFELCQRLEVFLEEAEKPIFRRAGKAHVFQSACQHPALLACRFRLARFHRVVRPVALG